MKFGLAVSIAALALLDSGPVRVSACQYCEQADDPAQQPVFATPEASASVPQAANNAVPASSPRLSAQPLPSTPGPMALRPSEKSVLASRTAKLAALRLPSTVLPATTAFPSSLTASSETAKVADQRSPGSQSWADFGLLSMAAAGGVFCWRTRRAV